jgi:hypothetical protein
MGWLITASDEESTWFQYEVSADGDRQPVESTGLTSGNDQRVVGPACWYGRNGANRRGGLRSGHIEHCPKTHRSEQSHNRRG